MVFTWREQEPMIDAEMRAVVRLADAGKVKDGDVIDRQKLAVLLGCTHKNAPCGNCLGMN